MKRKKFTGGISASLAIAVSVSSSLPYSAFAEDKIASYIARLPENNLSAVEPASTSSRSDRNSQNIQLASEESVEKARKEAEEKKAREAAQEAANREKAQKEEAEARKAAQALRAIAEKEREAAQAAAKAKAEEEKKASEAAAKAEEEQRKAAEAAALKAKEDEEKAAQAAAKAKAEEEKKAAEATAKAEEEMRKAAEAASLKAKEEERKASEAAALKAKEDEEKAAQAAKLKKQEEERQQALEAKQAEETEKNRAAASEGSTKQKETSDKASATKATAKTDKSKSKSSKEDKAEGQVVVFGKTAKDKDPYDDFFNSPQYKNWKSTYAGGQIGLGSGDSSGVSIGGFVGHNWQAGRLIYGVEAAASLHTGSDTQNVGLSVFSTDQNWSAEMRGRVGYLVQPDLMVYGTAGVALANYDVKLQSPVSSKSFSDTTTGFVIGAGLEKQFDENWSARVEYVYTDYDDITVRNGRDTATYDPDSHSIRVAFVYRF